MLQQYDYDLQDYINIGFADSAYPSRTYLLTPVHRPGTAAEEVGIIHDLACAITLPALHHKCWNGRERGGG